MSDTLNISIIQGPLVWEDAIKNRAYFSEKIKPLQKKTNCIVLPEMFTTGFSMNTKALAESTDGVTLKWMQDEAKKAEAAITGSFIIKEGTHYYNRLFFVYPSGEYHIYDKRHCFTLAGEHKNFTAGKQRLIVNYKGWRICPLICYDLRFPVWARNTEDYDILLYVANWPEKRIAAWDALLKARAIENMSYCIGVNRIGHDDNGHKYTGHSGVYDALGAQLSITDFEKEFTDTVSLSKKHINLTREKLGFLNDKDLFSLY